MAVFMASPPEDALNLLKNISEDDFTKKIKGQGLKPDRVDILFKIIKNQKQISHPDILWDIQRYALKALFPDCYLSLNLGHHHRSQNSLYEYDPPKNGQNIIKHGISFGEVTSYSSQFGTLSVQCPDEEDGTRCVIFSDLNAGDVESNLSVPLLGINGEVYTLSIAKLLDDSRLRFISSRLLSSENYPEKMKQAFKNVYSNDPERKKAFVNRCVEIIKRDLFKVA
jgi:hypothetical protein